MKNVKSMDEFLSEKKEEEKYEKIKITNNQK